MIVDGIKAQIRMFKIEIYYWGTGDRQYNVMDNKIWGTVLFQTS